MDVYDYQLEEYPIMPTLTGLPALIKRVQVLATSAVAWLSAISATLVVLAQQLESIGAVPEWATRAIASAIAVIAAITLQVRRVTPVADADKGLLPPKGPAVEVKPAGVKPAGDVGDIGLGILLKIVALVLLLVAGAIGADWITSVYAIAFLAFGLAAWVLSDLVP